MARTESFGMGGDNGAAGKQTVISAAPGEAVNVADAAIISNSDILRDGQDLILRAADGSEVVIENYFALEPSPTITAPGGAMLTPQLVDSFVRSANAHYAANEQTNDESPVGAVQEVKGTATVTRTDGTVETLTVGMAIYQGDIVETEGDGAVNIVFIDETSFAVSENAKMAIDEYVFDPSTESGTTNFSVLRGMFVFTSGLIGRDDPDDVEIDTPVGSIGIRGTTIAGNLNTGEITVVEGAIVLRGNDGTEVTLATQFETGRFNPGNGTVEVVGVLDGKAVSLTFAGIGPVVPAFFAAIGVTPTIDNGNGQDASGNPQAPNGNNNGNGAGTDPNAPQTQDQSAAPAEPQPLNADLSADVAGTADPFAQTSTFDSAAGATSTTGTQSAGTTATGGTSSGSTAQAGAPVPATTTTTTTADAGANTTPPPPPSVITPAAPPVINNFAPTLTASAVFTMPENSALSTPVTGILGTDADGNALTYSITGGAGLFSVSGGRIVVNGTLDFEAAGTHTVTVTVTDGAFTATESYTINITDQNDLSVFTSPVSVVVAENATPGTTLYTAVATDQDAGAISYSLGGAPGGFVINATTGVLTSAAADIDYEVVGGTVSLDVIATQGGVSVTHTITLNITNIDDTAPTVTNVGGAVDEGATLTLTAAMLQAADVDTSGAANLTYTVTTPVAGVVELSGSPTTTFTQADINGGLVTFVHDGSAGASGGFNFSVSDGTNVLGTQTFTISVTQVNDAPVLGAATPTLTATNEDDPSTGDTVQTIMSGSVTDDETAAASIGMAVTDADSANGTWQYFNGSWIDFPAVSTTSALLLAAGTSVRFSPDADFNGDATFSYKAWDGSAGALYSNVDTTAGTAFSTTINTATITVTAVNDAPFIDLDTLSGSNDSAASFTEGGAVAIVGSNISIGDPDSTIASVTASIITPPNGTFEKLIYTGTAQFLTDRGISITGDHTGTLTINGSAGTTAAQFAEVLQLIHYNNFYDNMTDGNRTINITAMDGSLTSTVRMVTLNATGVIDDDTFLGTTNADNFYGDAGNDTVYVSAGEDSVDGGGGVDTLNFSGAAGGATINLTIGNLTNAGFGAANYYISNFENVIGTAYADTITGNTFNNILSGGDGADTFYGGGGTDTLNGGLGNDTFYVTGTDGDLTIDGGAGIDVYQASGFGGAMTVNLVTGVVNRGAMVDNIVNVENFNLGSGNDVAKVTTGTFSINAGAGMDTLDFSALGAGINFNINLTTFNGAGVNLTHSGFERAGGTAYADTFYGNIADNRFEGAGGDDTFFASGGNNEYIGGTQSTYDTVTYEDAGAAVMVNLASGIVSNNGFGGTDTLTGIERFIGSDHNDSITVSTALSGLRILGGDGMDVLSLGVGGTYNFNTLGEMRGIELIDGDGFAGNLIMNIAVTNDMLADLASKTLTIEMDIGDALNLDLSAFTGGNLFTMSGSSAGTVSYYSTGLDRTITINHGGATPSVTGAGGSGGFSLNSMPAAKGYMITDDLGLGFGYAISAHGGDLDDDGYDDFVVTRQTEQNNGIIDTFTVNGAASAGGNITLAGAGGRVTPDANALIKGGSANQAVISSIRDWDGDGVQDFIVGVYAADSSDGAGGENLSSGAVQVISGDDGTILTELAGADSLVALGTSVSGAGDVNGDGYADFIVGSPGDYAGGTDAGKAYIIMGGATVPTEIDLTTASPSEVRVIQGVAVNSRLGQNVMGIGDFNNDGYDDVAISEANTSGTGSVHVVFGDGSPSVTLGMSTFTLAGIDMGGADEIALLGMGDINGDGISDMGFEGVSAGLDTMHLFFGQTNHIKGTYAPGTADAIITTGNSGVKIMGSGAVGDFNGDGVDDFGVAMMGTGSGTIDMYVVYGGSSLTGTLNQSFLNNAANAFRISYTVPAGTDTGELDVVMSAIGDVNGDGFADLGIGIANVDNDLGFDRYTDGINDNDGMIAVVYGHNDAGIATISASDMSTAAGQTLIGTDGADFLNQGASVHTDLVFRGGAGDDDIGIASTAMTAIADIDGGNGFDSLRMLVSGQTLNFNGVTSENFKGIDELSFGFGQTSQTMVLTLQQLFTMIETSDSQTLLISENSSIGAMLQIDDGAGASGTMNTASALASALGMTDGGVTGGYYTFYQGDNALMIDQALVDNSQVQII